tara:strand:+ start:91 stop:798 length:708 start_codon:yes stop_codon:yes gene_type:complete
MLTFCFIQIFLAILSFSLGSLYPYHLPNLLAQILLFIWNVFPYERLKQVSGLALGVAAVSSGFCALIAFIRAWRYIFFPVKENLSFFLQCVALIPLLVIQLVFYLYQYRTLSAPRRLQYQTGLFSSAIYFLFIHDFLYASLFIYNASSFYVFFGYSQFVVHSAMMIINNQNARTVTKFFSLVWAALLVQHGFVLSQYFAGTPPFDSDFVLVLTGVYIVADVLYLLNAVQLHGNDR